MATYKSGPRINNLIMAEQWVEARVLIEKALKKEPDSHWLWTQLGETYYEQRKYKKALKILLKSRDILPECPLTLWHLAGTLSALGYYKSAIRLFTWLLGCKKTPEEDPCWESEEWTDNLKTDCVYSLGICYENTGRKRLAENCFRRYIDICLSGIEGSYPIESAKKHIKELSRTAKNAADRQLQQTADWLTRESGEKFPRNAVPVLDSRSLRHLQEA